MRLVHITTIPESLGFLKGQLGFMKQHGIEIVAISSPGAYLDELGAAQQIETIAIPITRAISPLEDLKTLRALVRTLRELSPTIVHTHTPKAGLLGTLAAALARVPVRVYHLRGLPGLTATGAKAALLRTTERIACAAAHRVIAVSHSLRDVAIDQHLCRPDKITVLAGGSGNGVDSERFDPAKHADKRSATRAKFGIPDGARVIGFLGRLVRDKGIVELLAAWKELSAEMPDLHLLVGGMAEERDALPPEVLDALRSDPRIHWKGHDWESPPLYAAMDVVALPTYREGFPNVPLETAAMGLPIVATRVTGCVDAVQDGVTGTLVPVRDAGALAAALRRYLNDPPLRAAHGRAGRERVLLAFRQPVIWRAILDEYRALLATRARSRGRAIVKRAFDVAVAGTALAAGAVPMAMLGAVIAKRMGRPVLFRQKRPGKDEQIFELFKFRTMTDERGPDGQLLPDEQRLTPLGRFLRRTSLDELPELINVLRGEMSLVGPRPLLIRYLPYFTEAERRRHAVRPGITGWAQIMGRNAVTWDKRLGYDVWYVDHQSLWLDLTILAKTVGMVLRREGVVDAPNTAMLDLDQERGAS